MKRLLSAAALGVSMLLISACAYIPASDAKQAVGIALKAYVDVYQPLLITYGKLPTCPQAAPVCHDRALFAKLAAVDDAAVKSADAAIANPTGEGINAALTAIQTAQQQIAGNVPAAAK